MILLSSTTEDSKQTTQNVMRTIQAASLEMARPYTMRGQFFEADFSDENRFIFVFVWNACGLDWIFEVDEAGEDAAAVGETASSRISALKEAMNVLRWQESGLERSCKLFKIDDRFRDIQAVMAIFFAAAQGDKHAFAWKKRPIILSFLLALHKASDRQFSREKHFLRRQWRANWIHLDVLDWIGGLCSRDEKNITWLFPQIWLTNVTAAWQI